MDDDTDYDNDNRGEKDDDEVKSSNDDQFNRVVESPTELILCPKLLSSWLTSLIRKFHPMMMAVIIMMTTKQNDDDDEQ